MNASSTHERPVVILVKGLLLFEATLYAALTPVLPHYAHELHVSKSAVGILAGAYSGGLIPGSILGGWMAARIGVRRTTVIGLTLFAAATAVFGFGSDIVTLDILRLIQGVACGAIWGGGLTWVIAVAPAERRGAVLGSAIAAATVGTLIGPALGTLAVATSTQLVFLLLSGIALALAAWTVRHPEPVRRQGGSRVPARVLLGNRKIMLGFWLIVLAAATFGGLAALVPLRLSHFGAAGVAIGGTFVVASLISALTSGPVGRLFDRRGARLPLIISQLSGAALLIALPVPSSAIGLAILTVLVLGAPITASTIPGMAVLADGAEKAGAAVAVGALLINLAWAVGETIGAPVAANLAQATSDAVPIVLLGALFLVTALVVWRTLSGAPQPSSAQRRELLFN